MRLTIGEKEAVKRLTKKIRAGWKREGARQYATTTGWTHHCRRNARGAERAAQAQMKGVDR